MILPVLVLLEGQLCDPPLASAQVLLRIRQPPVLRIQLRLQLPDAGLHLGDGFLPTLAERIRTNILYAFFAVTSLYKYRPQ